MPFLTLDLLVSLSISWDCLCCCMFYWEGQRQLDTGVTLLTGFVYCVKNKKFGGNDLAGKHFLDVMLTVYSLYVQFQTRHLHM